MVYLVESSKSFAEVVFDLEPVVQRLGFVVLHAHDLGTVLRQKGIETDEDCQVFEIGNYRHIEKLLAIDPCLGLALPWRITVFTEHGATRIGLLRPASLLTGLSSAPRLVPLAREVEERMLQIVDEVR